LLSYQPRPIQSPALLSRLMPAFPYFFLPVFI
jgi:hypothetical protein